MFQMHPFFQKVSSKTHSQRPTPPKSENVTSSPEDSSSPSADSRFYDASTADSPASISSSQLGDHLSQKTATPHKAFRAEQDQMDTGHSTDLAADLNVDRRKRRKLTSSAGSQVPTRRKDPDWLHQLQEAAVNGHGPASEATSATDSTFAASPKTEESSFHPPTTPRRTPRKTRQTTTPEQSSKNSRARTEADPAIVASVTSPANKGTPKKKVLKLSQNGKLLSSPPLVGQQPRSKGRRVDGERDVLPKSRRVVIKYGTDEEGRLRVGTKINEILHKTSTLPSTHVPRNDGPPKPPHPFFLGKLARNVQSNAGGLGGSSNEDQPSESENQNSPASKPVAWEDIVFKSQKPTFTKTHDGVSASWPSNEIQHVGAAVRDVLWDRPLRLRDATLSKSKDQRTNVMSDENVMQNFSEALHSGGRPAISNVRIPQRVVTTGQQILAMLDNSTISAPDDMDVPIAMHPAVVRVRSLLPTTSTAFDQGKLGIGTPWTVKHAPQTANDVLQPAAGQLRDWMRSLTTSITQKTHFPLEGMIAKAARKPLRKKKRRKISDELDGFIASSDDEADGIHNSNIKNAVLISGPAGCGKTASVFAVAKELDFEVFEVHPGMRRSAKDIFDKVGDMTQNHLVQGTGDGNVATPDTNAADIDPIDKDMASGKQGTVNKFFSAKTQTSKQRKSPRKISSNLVENAKPSKAQRQSVILLEEIDILFDEDKGFWSGVISLISQSKRPIVLTCNDESSIPFDDLPLHAVWHYEPPAPILASTYLTALAAQEGHVLDIDCVRALYGSKGNDLRATITELEFWCQMGIGSQKGGLDWMLDHSSPKGQQMRNDDSLRVFSKDTYASGTGLALPSQVSGDYQQEALLNHAQDNLGIPVASWQETSDFLHTAQPPQDHNTLAEKRVNDLRAVDELLDSRSVLDLFNGDLTAALSVRIASALTNRMFVRPADVTRAYFTKSEPSHLTKHDLLSAFDPLTVEKPTFPPALGRLAPSLEGPTSTIATDVAPYVRSIVAFDQRLEQQREAMTGDLHGKKVRKTRAARAALEGGSKANTRREKWFPEKTNFTEVMQTAGNDWPIWTQNEPLSLTQSQE